MAIPPLPKIFHRAIAVLSYELAHHALDLDPSPGTTTAYVLAVGAGLLAGAYKHDREMFLQSCADAFDSGEKFKGMIDQESNRAAYILRKAREKKD